MANRPLKVGDWVYYKGQGSNSTVYKVIEIGLSGTGHENGKAVTISSLTNDEELYDDLEADLELV